MVTTKKINKLAQRRVCRRMKRLFKQIMAQDSQWIRSADCNYVFDTSTPFCWVMCRDPFEILRFYHDAQGQMIRAEYVYADLNYGIETTHKSGMIHPGDRDWPACVKAADCLREKHD